MSSVKAVSTEEDAAADRWSQWQRRNAVTRGRGARHARLAFTVLFAGVGAWLGLQLLAPSLWP